MRKKNILIKNLAILLIIIFSSGGIYNYNSTGGNYIYRVVRGKTNKRISWTKDKFREKLKKTVKGLGTTSATVFVDDEKGVKIYGAFDRHKKEWGYEDWQDALNSVGIKVNEKINWTKDKFKKKLKKIANKLNSTSVIDFQKDKVGKKVYGAFGRHKDKWGYESWSEAIKSVGFKPIESISWDKKTFKKKLKEVNKRLESTSTRDFQNDAEGIKVYGAFYNHKEEWGYDSWSDAIKSVGLEPAGKSKQLSEEEFMERLRKQFLRKLNEVGDDLENLSLKSFLLDKKGINVYLEFRNYKDEWGYDSWSDLVESVEFKTVERENESSPNMINWNKTTFKKKLKQVAERLESTSTKDFQNDKKEGIKVYGAFNRHKKEWGYETWEDALKSTGIK